MCSVEHILIRKLKECFFFLDISEPKVGVVDLGGAGLKSEGLVFPSVTV